MKNIIKTHSLSMHFGGVKAVDELTVEFPAGIATGLIGPNGSGKTTLMNVLCGLIKPTFGSMEISKEKYDEVNSEKLRELKIARTFQDGRLLDQLSVKDNLLLAIAENLFIKGLKETSSKKYDKMLNEVLHKIKLYEQRDKLAGELSYGQRKLLEVGRCIIQDAEIYFFDEPFTGLFPEVVEHVLELLAELKKQGKTLVVIEHDMGLIGRICDHTIVLDYGKLLAKGKPSEVFKNKKVQEAYLGM